jgi:hypothetical protein
MQIDTPFRMRVGLPTVDGVVVQDVVNGILESQLVDSRRDGDPFGEITLFESQLIARVLVARGAAPVRVSGASKRVTTRPAASATAEVQRSGLDWGVVRGLAIVLALLLFLWRFIPHVLRP